MGSVLPSEAFFATNERNERKLVKIGPPSATLLGPLTFRDYLFRQSLSV